MNQDIVIYTSKGCPHCDNVKQFLDEWNFDYTEKNISENKEYFKEMRANRVYGTPATYIGDQLVLGFQKRKLKKVLEVDDMPGYFKQRSLGM